MKFKFSFLLAAFVSMTSPAHAGADCVRLLKAQVSAAFGAQTGGPVSEADYIRAVDYIFDQLAEEGVDFSRLETTLQTNWLIEGGSLTEGKIRAAFPKSMRLIPLTIEIFTRLERDLSSRPELVAKIRAHVFESLQHRMTADSHERADVKERVQETRVIDVRFEPTSLGFIFEPVEHPTMGKSVKDPSGMIWSDVLPGKYTNEGTAQAGEVITDSEAAKACEKIRGRLPTKEDYESLRTYFERNGSDKMTEQGLRDFHRIFPDMRGQRFWSSSVHSFYSDYAYGLYGDLGVIVIYDRRYYNGAVRCVRCVR